MRNTIFILSLLLTGLNSVEAQQTKPTVGELVTLGRDSLIKMAIKKLNDTTFHASSYDRITVKSNATSVEVVFGLSITFKNKKTCFYDQVYVGLLNGNDGKSIAGDCKNPIFYKRSKSEQKKIDFVFDAINKSDEIGHLPGNKIPYGSTMTIEENGSYYYIEFSDDYMFSHYKIDKSSGKISEAGHKEYDRSGLEKDEWLIIK